MHGRAGHLFQGRFKSEPVTSDEYLMTVVRYIHQNPIKAGISRDCEYEWSSYRTFLAGSAPTDPIDILAVFGGIGQFVGFHRAVGEESDPLEVGEVRRQLDDSSALDVAKRVIGEDLENVKGMPRAERDGMLVRLKEAGLTARQIQRLTGVSLGTIARA